MVCGHHDDCVINKGENVNFNYILDDMHSVAPMIRNLPRAAEDIQANISRLYSDVSSFTLFAQYGCVVVNKVTVNRNSLAVLAREALVGALVALNLH